jgi:tetratricopeptide (TPR) repeat protein
MAMFSKEMALTLPLAVLLYEICFLKEYGKSIRWKRLAPFLVSLAIIPFVMWLTKSVNFKEMHRIADPAPGISPLHYLFTQFRVIVTYIRLVFLPLNQNLDYHYPIAKSLLELPVLASILFLTIIIITAIRIFPRYRLLSFGIFWFFLTLLPESSIIPITDVIFEHRLYLPMVGFSLFLVSALYYLLGKKIAFGDNSKRFSVVGKVLYTFPHHEKNLRVMITILLLTIACYSVLTYSRNLVWKDDLTLWDDTVRKSPHKSRPYNNRGLAYQDKGDLDLALSDYNKAIQINPNLAETYSNRGNIYQDKGDLDLALSDYNKAIQINPNLAEAYNNRALTYQCKSEFDQAIAGYNKTLEINPYYAEAYDNRGNVYQSKGDVNQALADYNKALQINPNLVEAYNNRGLTYQSKGDFKQAIADYDKALQINPNYAEAYNSRGLAYQSKGDFKQAIADYNKALQINPNLASAYLNRGLAYQSKGDLNQALVNYNKALQIHPNLVEVYSNRGNIYQSKGDLDLALSDYNKALQMNPNLSLAYNNRAVIYFFKREYNKTWEDVHKAEALGYKVHPEFLEELKKASGRER